MLAIRSTTKHCMVHEGVASDLSRIYHPACSFTYSPQGGPPLIGQVVPRIPVVICANMQNMSGMTLPD